MQPNKHATPLSRSGIIKTKKKDLNEKNICNIFIQSNVFTIVWNKHLQWRWNNDNKCVIKITHFFPISNSRHVLSKKLLGMMFGCSND